MRGTPYIIGVALALPAWSGCQDTQLSPFDPPPQVSILAPEEGQRFGPGTLVELVGVANDGAGTTKLEITWSSDLDGRLGGDPPDIDGNVFWPVNDLSVGEHILTLEAVDVSGQSATTAVGIEIASGQETTPATTTPATTTPTTTTPPDPEAPQVLLTSPADLSVYVRDDLVQFVATVTDLQQAPETLDVTLSSSTDGILWQGRPNIAGSVSHASDTLSIGIHDVTLTAVDDDGNVGSAEARIEIANDGRPFARIDAPLSGTTLQLGQSLTFEGTLWDFEDYSIDLQYLWESDLDGLLAQGSPDSAGYTAFATTALSAGTHLVTLTALDTDGQNAADSVLVVVEDPGARDLDLDGYTPNNGDCDDTDPLIHPGAPETCDGIDNDCDGALNDGFEDAYEASGNDTHATASWLGEIDDELSGTEVVTLAGMTLHEQSDEDWFEWDADDDWYDNVDITVEVTLPASGNYVVELYWNDGGTLRLKDSTSGSGTVTLGAQGSSNIFEEDEDIWAVRVYSAPGGWDPTACSGSYTVEITS